MTKRTRFRSAKAVANKPTAKGRRGRVSGGRDSRGDAPSAGDALASCRRRRALTAPIVRRWLNCPWRATATHSALTRRRAGRSVRESDHRRAAIPPRAWLREVLMQYQRVASALAFTIGVGVHAEAANAPVAIDHDALSCIVAGQFSSIQARFSPPGEVARARVYFRADGVSHWYYVVMQPDAEAYAGLLPKAKPETKAVHYYVEGLGR